MNIEICELPSGFGRYVPKYNLSSFTWFNVGGPAEILFKPDGVSSLSSFMKITGITPTVIGVGSNIIVRDLGISGVTVKLGKSFNNMSCSVDRVSVGGAVLLQNVAKFAQTNEISGLEFLIGIPGTVGGALTMNAGCYGSDIESVLEYAIALDSDGNLHTLTVDDIGYVYRGNSLPRGWIFVDATLRGVKGDKDKIMFEMNRIADLRQKSQPLRARTGGSTFKNPPGAYAWELIEKSGCRNMKVGGASISSKHLNFLVNSGQATAFDLEILGNKIKKRVMQYANIDLKWEIRILGRGHE